MTEPKIATERKVITRRARQRATQLLIERHQEEFADLMQQEIRVATTEVAMLTDLHPVPEGASTVLLRPGRRKKAEKAVNRIDTATCRRCHTSHDRGHVCPNCGSTQEEEA